MTIPCLDVSEFSSAVGCSAPRVVVSLGVIGSVANPDPSRRAVLVGLLVKKILDGGLERREIDDDRWFVTLRSKTIDSARTFVIIKLDRPGGPVLAILAAFELEITEGEYRIEVFERRAEKAKVLN